MIIIIIYIFSPKCHRKFIIIFLTSTCQEFLQPGGILQTAKYIEENTNLATLLGPKLPSESHLYPEATPGRG